MTAAERMRTYLRPYQERFLTDTSNRVIVLKARQIGMSEASAILAVKEAARKPFHDVYLASVGLREAKELLHKSALWVRMLSSQMPALAESDVQATKITLPNGSRILALPALKIRGRSGTIILDEFAFQPRCNEIWKAIAPAAESQKDMRIILISTPFGTSGKFHEIWTNLGGHYSDWSRHHIDVYQAAREGFPVDPDEMSKRYRSDEWSQEFLCQFGVDADQYFSRELINKAVSDSGIESPDFHAVGIDLASTRDASVMTPLSRSGEHRHIESPIYLKEAGDTRDYADQYADITAHLDSTSYDRIAVDGAGEGKQVSQDLTKSYRGITTVWGSGMWRTQKPLTVMDMKRDMERGTLTIDDDLGLVRALGRVRRIERSDKTVTFDVSRDQHGHGDEFSAALMAYHASIEKKKLAPPKVGSAPRSKRAKMGNLYT